jgi:hypothetical protein
MHQEICDKLKIPLITPLENCTNPRIPEDRFKLVLAGSRYWADLKNWSRICTRGSIKTKKTEKPKNQELNNTGLNTSAILPYHSI